MGFTASLNPRRGALTFILFLLCFSVFGQSPLNIKKELKAMPGTWHGTYSWRNAPEVYSLSLVVEQASKDEISGSFYWADYFNSRTAIKGAVTDQTIDLRETQLLQGIDMNLSGTYRINSRKGDTLTGVWINEKGKERADFWLLKEGSYTDRQLKAIREKNQACVERFGTVSIFPLREEVEAEEIYQRYIEQNKAFNFQSMEAEGYVTYSNVEMPVYFSWKYPDKLFMKLEAMNKHFLHVVDGDSVWEYNPVDDNLTIRLRGAEDEENVVLPGTGVSKLEEGYKPAEAQEADVNGVKAYRLVLEKNGFRIVYFIEKENHLLIRKEERNEISAFSDFKEVEGNNIPFRIELISEDEKNLFSFNEFRIGIDISDDLFVIPDELRSKLVRKNEKDDHYFFELGRQHYEEGSHMEAIEAYTSAIGMRPGHAVYFYHRGIAKTDIEDYYGAISDFNRASELDRYFKEAFNRCGLAKYYLGDYERAIVDFDKAINLDSAYEDPYFNRGSAYYFLDQVEKARKDFSRLVGLDSINSRYLYNLGLTLAELGKYEEAIAQYEAALEYDKDNVHYQSFRRGPIWIGAF